MYMCHHFLRKHGQKLEIKIICRKSSELSVKKLYSSNLKTAFYRSESLYVCGLEPNKNTKTLASPCCHWNTLTLVYLQSQALCPLPNPNTLVTPLQAIPCTSDIGMSTSSCLSCKRRDALHTY